MIVLDTHVWWWAISEPAQLSRKARQLITKMPPEQRAIASISIWEFAMMVTRGHIELTISPDEWLDYAINKTGLTLLELNSKIALESCNLPGNFHKDPADRIIVATARVSRSQLITKDQKIIEYPHVTTVW
ncbi:MAG: type II toxin-antitoxin system VapC family toxin [Desulfobacterales bacterium]|nr:MAG: type II toxin-antitoxin system VapC family toxin [Desulfobacterales bacterium]